MTAPAPSLTNPSTDGCVYAVVRFDSSDRCQAAGVVVAFESTTAADHFARASGLDRYQVVPVGFHLVSPRSGTAERPA